MESVFSNQMEAMMPNGAPAAPVINKVEFRNGSAFVTVSLPTKDADGSPLTGLRDCYMFVKTTSFEGSTPEQERAAGTQSAMLVIDMLAGGEVTFEIPGLKYDTKYFFASSCDD